MSVLNPGFSERVFEFSFNAEYADRNRAVLAGAPDIPTQNKEKFLGYDVAFEVKRRGGAVHTIALQHKVSRLVDGVGPTNGHFRQAMKGPYFAFRLDKDQYNLIETVASAGMKGIECHFCAPVFVSRLAMDTRYMTRTVEANSVWINVANAGQITDDDPHTIVYSGDGKKAFRFSQKAVALEVLDSETRRARWMERRGANFDNAGEIYETVFNAVTTYWRRRRGKAARNDNNFRSPQRLPTRSPPTVENAANLLSEYLGTSLLIEVRT